VAAALADAFINDPCSRSFGRGACGRKRGYERCSRSKSSSTCWRTGEPCGRLPARTARWPSCHPAPGRCRSRRRGRRHSSGYGPSGRDCPARSESGGRWRSDTYVSLTSTSERSGCVPHCRDRAWDRRSCSRRWREPIRLGYRHTSRPAVSAAQHCTNDWASCTFTDVEIATPVDCAAERSLFALMLFPVLNGNVVVSTSSSLRLRGGGAWHRPLCRWSEAISSARVD
jgi:hypothetical protein